MAREVMTRRASDNVYLHKDFHGALSAGIEYLDRRYGEESVREYLRAFTRAFYSPLIQRVKTEGLKALAEHFEKIYEIEGAEAGIKLEGDTLTVSVPSCPAITHMRKHGYPVARLFHETTRTVNETLCEGTPYRAELVEYDYETGGSIQRFSRREP